METANKAKHLYSQVFQEKTRAFLKSVKVPLGKFQIKQSDPKLVARQEDDFRNYGCWRLDSIDHVEVLISRQLISEIPSHSTDPFPWFDPKDPLVCMNGHYLIEAAQRYLKDDDAWWVADLYLDGK